MPPGAFVEEFSNDYLAVNPKWGSAYLAVPGLRP